jgi:PAS domain-containing protein
MIHPDDAQRVSNTLAAHLEYGAPYAPDFRLKSKSGDWVWVQSKGAVVEWDKAGRPLRMLGVHQDITERKQMEEALRESESRYRTVIENIQDIFYRTDKGGFLTMASPSAAHLLGYDSLDEIIGKPV